jgi:hypothetical protein
MRKHQECIPNPGKTAWLLDERKVSFELKLVEARNIQNIHILIYFGTVTLDTCIIHAKQRTQTPTFSCFLLHANSRTNTSNANGKPQPNFTT